MDLDPTVPCGARLIGEISIPDGKLFLWKFGPRHFYGTVQWEDGSKQRVVRQLQAEEISADPYTWANYSPGDDTERHYTAEDVKRNASAMDAPASVECDLTPDWWRAEPDEENDPSFACEALGSRWTVGYWWPTGEAFLMKDGHRATWDDQFDLEEVRQEWLYEAAEIVVHYLGMDPHPDVYMYWWDDPAHSRWLWPWSPARLTTVSLGP